MKRDGEVVNAKLRYGINSSSTDTAPAITMEGGTTFEFVTDGIEAALKRAFEAAAGKDVRVGGGVATVQQYLRAGLIDEMHVAVVPVLLHGGERLFADLGEPNGYEVSNFVPSGSVAHFRLSPA